MSGTNKAIAAAAGLGAILLAGAAAAEAPARSHTCAGNGIEQFVADPPLQIRPSGNRTYRAPLLLKGHRGGKAEAELVCTSNRDLDCEISTRDGTVLADAQMFETGPEKICGLATAVAGMAYLRLR